MSSPPRSQPVPYTYRDYLCLPDDGRRYELIDGDLFVSPAPTPFHQTVSRRLQYALMTALEQTGIAFVFNAPCDVLLADTTVVQPDLAIVRQDHRDIVTGRALEGAPALVVEILSPSTRDRDLYLKRDAYARFGVAEYWVVDPDRGFVEVYSLEDGAYAGPRRYDRASTLESPAFPEVSIPLNAIFRPI
jgi:Uma2 family endonuclease